MKYGGRVACGIRRQAFNKPGITVKTWIFALPTLHRVWCGEWHSRGILPSRISRVAQDWRTKTIGRRKWIFRCRRHAAKHRESMIDGDIT